ncbi:MAG: hypothetical protein COA43_08140 [Robiginitomaculum sp.]|nr:MAG: hypothetical protein COA43_08140 [Robiginitomaculum sp.]
MTHTQSILLLKKRSQLDRRRLLLGTGGLLITAMIGGCEKKVTPKQAVALNAVPKGFSKKEAKTFTRFAETIVPGSDDAGTLHFVDYQLSQDPSDCLLMLKYFQITPPYIDFYSSGLAALNTFSNTRFGKDFTELSKSQCTNIVEQIVKGTAEWDGPPAFLFYMFVRSDAIDMVYGTPEGFEKLDIPYMAHIEPPQAWSL